MRLGLPGRMQGNATASRNHAASPGDDGRRSGPAVGCVWTATALLAFAVHLLLASFAGDLVLWAPDQLIAGAVISLLVALATGRFVWAQGGWRLLQPHRWVLFVIYLLGPFLYLPRLLPHQEPQFLRRSVHGRDGFVHVYGLGGGIAP